MPAEFIALNVRSYIYLLVFVSLLPGTDLSIGDRSEAYRRCLYWCSLKNCSTSSHLKEFKNLQPWYMFALLWDCKDECEYSCMWYAVNSFRKRGQPVPQFHGKWPFIRIFGVQEPASALFSLFNGISHYCMWKKFRKYVPDATGFNIWNVQAFLSINAWTWSLIFHVRDIPLTEKLDYYGAFSLVLYSFYSLLVKISSKLLSPLAIAVPFFAFFTYHIYYLTFVKFDYGYNLKSNVIVGLMNSCGWLMWCWKNRHKRYVWKCAVSVLSVNVLLLLELSDFPPWSFLVDAHALWHLGTIPVPLLWYSFLIEECLYEKKFNENSV